MTTPRSSSASLRDLTPSLVGRLRAGDDGAAALFEQLYRDPLTRFCRGYLGSEEDARDAVQEVTCRVLTSQATPENFRAWVYRIARNRCLDLIRSRNRHGDETLATEPGVADDLTGHLTHLVREEEREQLRRLVADLPGAQREILRLRYVDGLARSEIADVLELPESVVKSRLFEGLERLRRRAAHLRNC